MSFVSEERNSEEGRILRLGHMLKIEDRKGNSRLREEHE